MSEGHPRTDSIAAVLVLFGICATPLIVRNALRFANDSRPTLRSFLRA